MHETIPTITVYSENFSELYRRWNNSIPEGLEPIVKKIELIDIVHTGFATKSWYDAICQKIQFFIDTLESIPDDKICLCCDVDIFFIKKDQSLYTYLTEEMKNKNLDMLFMRENTSHEVNGGFYCVKNSDKVRSVLKEAKEFCTQMSGYGDQDFYNGNFKQKDIQWEYIDVSKVIWGENVFNYDTALFHHAVCCLNLEDKLRQQNRIAQSYKIDF